MYMPIYIMVDMMQINVWVLLLSNDEILKNLYISYLAIFADKIGKVQIMVQILVQNLFSGDMMKK